MTDVIVQDTKCWLCGEIFDPDNSQLSRTVHHTIPQHLKPVNNLTIPIHKKCHDVINAVDERAFLIFAQKIEVNSRQLDGSVKALMNLIHNKQAINFKVKGGKNDKMHT